MCVCDNIHYHFVLFNVHLNKNGWTISMNYPFCFNLSGETMALKLMWSCGLPENNMQWPLLSSNTISPSPDRGVSVTARKECLKRSISPASISAFPKPLSDLTFHVPHRCISHALSSLPGMDPRLDHCENCLWVVSCESQHCLCPCSAALLCCQCLWTPF